MIKCVTVVCKDALAHKSCHPDVKKHACLVDFNRFSIKLISVKNSSKILCFYQNVKPWFDKEKIITFMEEVI